MFLKMLSVLCVLCTIVLIGCSKMMRNENQAPATNSSSPASEANKAAPATAKETSGEKIGVPECDEFLAKYEACVSSKVPEMFRGQYQSMLKQWRDSWKKLAENPTTKPTLVNACKQAREQQEAALKIYGCAL